MLRPRTLLGPGPGPTGGHGRPGQALLGHLDPLLLQVLDETSDRLRQIFGTANRRTLPLSATGSAGRETALVNVLGPTASRPTASRPARLARVQLRSSGPACPTVSATATARSALTTARPG